MTTFVDYAETVLDSSLQNIFGGLLIFLFLFLMWICCALGKNISKYADFCRLSVISSLLILALSLISIDVACSSLPIDGMNDTSECQKEQQAESNGLVSFLNSFLNGGNSSADTTDVSPNKKHYDQRQLGRHIFLFGVLNLIIAIGFGLFAFVYFWTNRHSVKTEFKTFWKIFFTSVLLIGIGLLITLLLIKETKSEFPVFLSRIYTGIRTFGKDWGIPVVVGVVAWLTYVANRESIDRPYFSVFFVDYSLYNYCEKNKRHKTTETENEKKLVEIVPFYNGKHPLNNAENEEFTVSICIKNTQPPGALFHKGAPGSNVSIFFYMPPGIVPFCAYRRDAIAENRQVLEACEYGLFKDRSYIAVPVAFNVPRPSITMMSREEVVVVEITSRIEKPLTDDFLDQLQSVGIQITSNEGITADVKWLYLKFEGIDIDKVQKLQKYDDDVGNQLTTEESVYGESNDLWNNVCDRLFRSLNDGIFTDADEPDLYRSSNENKDNVRRTRWNLAVISLLNNKESRFRRLIDDLKSNFEKMPGHESKVKWTENQNYEVLSKLLSAIWYLMDKELIPPSPDFQRHKMWDRKRNVISSLEITDGRSITMEKMSERLGKNINEYTDGMKTYLEYTAYEKPGMQELIRAFYRNCESGYYLQTKNYEDWKRFNQSDKRPDEDFENRIEYIKKNPDFPPISTFLEDFIFVHKGQLLEICYNKTNCRSTPQRAFPLVTVLPTDGSVGVLELGCHRGDVGLALLNLDFILTNPKNYFTQGFREFIGGDKRDLRWICNPVQKYFGVTDTLVSDDDWALAQWGPNREMREKLKRFHYDFRSGSNERFRRVKADLCDVNSYVMEANEFFKGMDNLVVLTSYALCFIPFDKRRKLAQAIRTIQKYYETTNPTGKFFWYNQGRSVDEIFDEKASKNIATRFHLGEMCFKGAFLFGTDLLRLGNDLHSGWRRSHFSVLCQSSNKSTCESFIRKRRVFECIRKAKIIRDHMPEEEPLSKVFDPGQLVREIKKTEGMLHWGFESYIPVPWNEGLYCVDGGRYDELIYNDPYIAQETSIYANIVFPMLENPEKEAGSVQRLLESQKMCYVGSNSKVVQTLADIEKCRTIWREAGVPALDYVVCESEEGTARLFQSLPERLHLAFDSIRIVPAFSGIDRKRWRRECSDYYTFDAAVKNGLMQYEKLIIEPRRFFSRTDEREYVIYAPIIENGLKAVALPAYMDKRLIDPNEGGQLAFDNKIPKAQKFRRLQVINMAKRLALDAYRAVGCQDFGVVEIVYSERFGLQVSRIQPLPYFWEYSKSLDDKEIVDILGTENISNSLNQAKERRYCEGFGLPQRALENGFFYSWKKLYETRGFLRNLEINRYLTETLLCILCNMAQRDDGDRRRLMHILWYDEDNPA